MRHIIFRSTQGHFEWLACCSWRISADSYVALRAAGGCGQPDTVPFVQFDQNFRPLRAKKDDQNSCTVTLLLPQLGPVGTPGFVFVSHHEVRKAPELVSSELRFVQALPEVIFELRQGLYGARVVLGARASSQH